MQTDRDTAPELAGQRDLAQVHWRYVPAHRFVNEINVDVIAGAPNPIEDLIDLLRARGVDGDSKVAATVKGVTAVKGVGDEEEHTGGDGAGEGVGVSEDLLPPLDSQEVQAER